MQSFLNSEEMAYDPRYMKRKLLDHYGSDIFISGEIGKSDIITYRQNVDSILREYYNKPKDVDIDLQKIRLIEAAAQLLKTEIKSNVTSSKDFYPDAENLDIDSSLAYLPKMLRLLCTKLFVGKDTDTKVAAIGQSIIQAVRPRAVLVPLQVGLSVQMHHKFRSKYLVETLNHLGFCSPYTEVLKFERNAAISIGVDLKTHVKDDSSVKFVADNVDHNLCTLNGENTFHGMGMIATISKGKFCAMHISRKEVFDTDLLSASSIDITPFIEVKKCETGLNYKPLPEKSSNSDNNIDLLWKLSWNFKNPTPIWSGYMQLIYEQQSNDKHKKDNILFLPIIDLNSSDMTCILSTLTFLSKLAADCNQPSVVTFDQPLYWKGNKIVKASSNPQLKQIVLMLGTFHTVMNLLGCIGYIMHKTGLSDILELIYGENAVVHMLNGKAYSRAMRGHLIIDQALSHILINQTCSGEVAENEYFQSLHDGLLNKTTTIPEVETNETIVQINNNIDTLKQTLVEKSRTAKLWIGYQNIIAIIKKFIEADRIAKWHLHLEALNESLPIFAASGHGNYAKSIYLYLQSMLELEKSHPIVFDRFVDGGFVVRRSERCWAGLPNDLIIEQVLMRSLKTSGGLTRGTGMTDVQRAIWLLSNPISSRYCLEMEENVGVHYCSSEQHKTATSARMKRDRDDTLKVMEKLEQVSPFTPDPTLRNITNGIVAENNVNVDNFVEVGSALIKEMEGHNVFSYSFKRNDRVKNMATVTVANKKEVTIDPALLFQRLLVVAKSTPMDISEVLQYELCSYPPSIFETSKLLRKANKPQIVEAIVKSVSQSLEAESSNEVQVKTDQYVLDGGSLVHRIKWPKNATYAEIASLYSKFVISNYGAAIIVFDGYSSSPSTKDVTHERRAANSDSRQINFTEEMKCDVQKDVFLANSQNKEKLIRLIGRNLSLSNCKIIYADEDADVDIAKVGVSQSLIKNTTVIGEDTDLLVLLLYYSTTDTQYNLLFRSDIRRAKKENITHDIIKYRKSLGNEYCCNILFIHSFTGCDTTSAFYCVGKGTALREFVKNDSFNEIAKVFTTPETSHDEIEDAGEKAALVIYKSTESKIDATREMLLSKKVLQAKSFVKPEMLPPTSSALKYHSFRCYYQIMKWCKNDLNAEQWGWINKDNKYYPKTMDKLPAPEFLLKIIHCNCTSDCSTMRCSCKKNGLQCTDLCRSCATTECSNSCFHAHGTNDELSEDELSEDI